MSGSIIVLVASEFLLSAALEADWLQSLPEDRRAALRRWPDVQRRHRSLVGTRLLSEGLARLGHSPTVLSSLRHRPRARPMVDGPVEFSVSHCVGKVVCAVSARGPVGVDVEAVGSVVADEFRLYLNANERAWAGPSARRFHSLWTRKEAVVKAACADGLAAVAEVDTASYGAGARHATFRGHRWRTTRLSIGRGHVAHLAHADGAMAVRIEHVSVDALETSRSTVADVCADALEPALSITPSTSDRPR